MKKLIVVIAVGLSAVLPTFEVNAGGCPTSGKGFYRYNWEEALKHKLFEQPSKVNDWNEAIAKARYYLKLGDQHQAGIRVAQAAVILEDKYRHDRAFYFVRPYVSELENTFGYYGNKTYMRIMPYTECGSLPGE